MFASILRWHYARAPVDQRPKVLGMTASPIDSAKAAIGAGEEDAVILVSRSSPPRRVSSLLSLFPSSYLSCAKT